jgi:ribosomal protein S6--L-glutamate ligase
LGTLSFPFVVQPFQAGSKDVRVVMLGDYKEAYRRHNPNNFRHNLHCGGMSASCDLTDDQIELSREIMNRARFPYAHIDLLITSSGSIWLNEINLRGGLRGAVISQQDYIRAVDKIHADLLGQYTG